MPEFNSSPVPQPNGRGYSPPGVIPRTVSPFKLNIFASWFASTTSDSTQRGVKGSVPSRLSRFVRPADDRHAGREIQATINERTKGDGANRLNQQLGDLQVFSTFKGSQTSKDDPPPFLLRQIACSDLSNEFSAYGRLPHDGVQVVGNTQIPQPDRQ